MNASSISERQKLLNITDPGNGNIAIMVLENSTLSDEELKEIILENESKKLNETHPTSTEHIPTEPVSLSELEEEELFNMILANESQKLYQLHPTSTEFVPWDLENSTLTDEELMHAILKEERRRLRKLKHPDLYTTNHTLVRACNKNRDCMRDECCLQQPWSDRFFCAPRIREGKICWSQLHNATMKWDRFRIVCPCVRENVCRFNADSTFVLKPFLAVSTCQPRKKPQ
nr:uncharacterized protein LOC107450299 isoform X2 [Parasteatoda tepidariorum]